MPNTKLCCATIHKTHQYSYSSWQLASVLMGWCPCCTSCAIFWILLFHLQPHPTSLLLPSHREASYCMLTNQQFLSLSFFFLSFSFFSSQTLSRNDAVDVTFSLKGLYDDTKAFLDENLVSGGGWNKGGQSIPSKDGHGLCLLMGHWKTYRCILAKCLPGSPCCLILTQGCHWLYHFIEYTSP